MGKVARALLGAGCGAVVFLASVLCGAPFATAADFSVSHGCAISLGPGTVGLLVCCPAVAGDFSAGTAHDGNNSRTASFSVAEVAGDPINGCQEYSLSGVTTNDAQPWAVDAMLDELCFDAGCMTFGQLTDTSPRAPLAADVPIDGGGLGGLRDAIYIGAAIVALTCGFLVGRLAI